MDADNLVVLLTDNSFKCIFMNEKFCILIWISLKFVPKDPIDNKPPLIQVMAWHQTCNKPLPESILTQFTDAYHICGTGGDELTTNEFPKSGWFMRRYDAAANHIANGSVASISTRS